MIPVAVKATRLLTPQPRAFFVLETDDGACIRGSDDRDRQWRALSPSEDHRRYRPLRRPRDLVLGVADRSAALCAGDEIVLVGGGNSAGQGAVFLFGHASARSA